MAVVADFVADIANPKPANWRYCNVTATRLVVANWVDLTRWVSPAWIFNGGLGDYDGHVGADYWHPGVFADRRTVVAAWQASSAMTVQVEIAASHNGGASSNGVVFYLATGAGTLTQRATSGAITMSSWTHTTTVNLTSGDYVALMLDHNGNSNFDAALVSTFRISAGSSPRRRVSQSSIRSTF